MRYLKYIITSALVVLMVSCDAITGDPDLPIPLEETMENTGAFLRVLGVETAAIDINNIPEAEYAFVGEVSDSQEGQLVETINFYAAYVDINRNRIEETSSPVVSVSASELTVSEESGLPRGTFRVPATAMMNGLGLEEQDLNIGDRFDIRWEVVLEDGRSFSRNDISPAMTGGFYSSPFFARAEVAIAIPEDMFVGSYTFTQEDPAPTVAWAAQFSGNDNPEGWLFNSQSSPETFTAELGINPENSLNGRIFEAVYMEEWGYGPSDVPIAFGDGTVTLGGEVNNGLGCGQDITLNATDGAGSYNLNDDSEFTLVLTENAREDCDFESSQVSFTVTKN